jgi:hypothetical protein
MLAFKLVQSVFFKGCHRFSPVVHSVKGVSYYAGRESSEHLDNCIEAKRRSVGRYTDTSRPS